MARRCTAMCGVYENCGGVACCVGVRLVHIKACVEGSAYGN